MSTLSDELRGMQVGIGTISRVQPHATCRLGAEGVATIRGAGGGSPGLSKQGAVTEGT